MPKFAFTCNIELKLLVVEEFIKFGLRPINELIEFVESIRKRILPANLNSPVSKEFIILKPDERVATVDWIATRLSIPDEEVNDFMADTSQDTLDKVALILDGLSLLADKLLSLGHKEVFLPVEVPGTIILVADVSNLYNETLKVLGD